MDIFAARLVDSRQSVTRMFWVLRRKIVIRVNVMMIQVKRDLEIICYSILELFAKIEDILGALLFFPTRGHPLLKFPPAFGEQIGGVSPGEDCLVGAGKGKTK